MLKKIKNKVYNGHGLFRQGYDPYNPLNLPPYTIRFKFLGLDTPPQPIGSNLTLVEDGGFSYKIYDLTYENNNWNGLFNKYSEPNSLYEILGANSNGVETMNGMFNNCLDLSAVSLFNTSSVYDITDMFNHCTALSSLPNYNFERIALMSGMCDTCMELRNAPYFNTTDVTNMDWAYKDCFKLENVPLYDTTNTTSMNYTFGNCFNVTGGALALYQQASTQQFVPSHNSTFLNCGRDSDTGSAELAQIPWEWKT